MARQDCVTIGQISDIRMDQTRAADPAAVDAARARLRQIAAGNKPTELFAAAGIAASRADGSIRQGATPETFVKFEAMVLQTFLQSMMPEDGEAVYGEGLAGQMWKSFLAKEIGAQMAKAGGIGIADRILGDFYLSGKTRIPVSGVSGGAEKAENDAQDLLSTALVQEIQRNITRAIDEDMAARSRSPEP